MAQWLWSNGYGAIVMVQRLWGNGFCSYLLKRYIDFYPLKLFARNGGGRGKNSIKIKPYSSSERGKSGWNDSVRLGGGIK